MREFTCYSFAIILALLSQAGSEKCSRTEHQCDGRCVIPCDGFTDCKDGADETTSLCSQIACSNDDTISIGDIGEIDLVGDVTAHAFKKFRCNYGGCISQAFLCNGRANCWDGSDETTATCSPRKCDRLEFRCAYGGCIRRLWKCDGKADCHDGSDETHELCGRERCSSRKSFRCDYGACIEQNKKCDGKADCQDDSDESPTKCGAGHTFNRREDIVKVPVAESTLGTPAPPATPPPATPLPATLPPATPLPATPPPATPPPATPPPATPPPATPPTIVSPKPSPEESTDPCLAIFQCTCPGSGICVPCDRQDYCSSNTKQCALPANSEERGITVDILACGPHALVNVAVFSRNYNALCTSNEVPLETIVIADCWGTATLLAQCREDGKWHPYGDHLKETTMDPMKELCQPENVNSLICGRRPRYRRPIIDTYIIRAHQQWPWLVAVFRRYEYACTATVISPEYILTAAHCVTTSAESTRVVDRRELTVHYLAPNGSVISDFLTDVHIHPNYVGGPRPLKDVALLKVERRIIFSHRIVPACLSIDVVPEALIAATFNRSDNNLNVWETILQQYDPRCHSPLDRCHSLEIEADQFCSIEVGSSKTLPRGASGGPYLVNVGNDVKEKWTVAGIVSSISHIYNCRQPFTIFTRVPDFFPWIENCAHRQLCSGETAVV